MPFVPMQELLSDTFAKRYGVGARAMLSARIGAFPCRPRCTWIIAPVTR
jgi:hypothetical protein